MSESIRPLLPHQHAVLVDELRSPEWDGRSANEVFETIATPTLPTASPAMKRLARTKFVPAAKFTRMIARMNERHLVKFIPVSGDFPTGVPGFPNKVLREWFDLAWKEARG